MISSINGAGKTGYPYADGVSYTTHKNQLKWIKDLNIRHKTIKLLKENIVENLLDICVGNDFLDMTLNAQATKAKISKQDYIKLESVRTAKETINRVKRQPMQWEKIFASCISDNEFISKIYKELIQLNSKQTNKQKTQLENRQRT